MIMLSRWETALRPLGAVFCLISLGCVVAALNHYSVARGFAGDSAWEGVVRAETTAQSYAMGAIIFLLVGLWLLGRRERREPPTSTPS